ncbi:MAG: ATP-binding protein [Nitrospiraceae bacterium]|nr:ATP-binding protein [Nitrospiraceae bacterium]
MRLSETSKIVFPILLIALFVFSTFAWVYHFQSYQMGRTIEAERLLDEISEGMQEINWTIQSGILTHDERYAVQSARHSLRVFERLAFLEKLHPADAAAIRSMYLDHYVKIVSINSLFLENRLEEGSARLVDLEKSYSRMNAEMQRVIDLQTDHYRKVVRNINAFMAVTSVIFTVLLTLIAGLFMRYSRKRKEAEKALVESEKMASLGTLSAGVAHEIRNPLTIILHGVEHLEGSFSSDSSRQDIVKGIKQAVLRAEGIIKGLLSFAQGPSAGSEKLNVPSVLDQALLILGQQIDLGNICIEKEFLTDALDAPGDRVHLRQAFLNILVNAVEAMPGGGILKVFCGQTNTDSLSITFTDTGEGIPESEIGNVSDPFYTTKQKFGNIGLGLSVARGIIERYGGTLKIVSAPGKGTRTTVTLPVSG